MFIIPDFAPAIVALCWEQLVQWFSEQVYIELLKRDSDHLLVKLRGCMDFGQLEAACASFHHTEGPGAKPTHTVPRLVRALLVGYLFDWSLRQLEWHIRFNLVVKWFVGYPIFAAGPDHTTLERFEQWVCAKQHRTIFDDVLRQIDADFPEERLKPQIGDTYALQANAAKESLVRLIRHTCQRLLAVLAQVDPHREALVRTQLDIEALFGAANEPSSFRLTAEQRAARLQTTVLSALHCARQVRAALEQPTPLPEPARAAVTLWLDSLAKIIQDEIELLTDQDGAIIQVTERTTHVKGAYRIASATDLEATYRVHGEDKCDLAYNISVAATDNFVREARADTGAQPDAVAIPDLLTAQQEHHDLIPPKFIYDAAAGTGKTHAEVAAASDGQTQLVAPLIDYDKSSQRFSPQDFVLSENSDCLTCPNGKTSSIAYRSGSGDGRTFRFAGKQCAGCPLWEQCRTQQPGSKAIRNVFISDYRAEFEAAQAYMQTPDFKLDMKLRPQIERVIAGVVRYNGGRRARRRGQDNADFQAKMNATAFNIKRWITLRFPKPQPVKT